MSWNLILEEEKITSDLDGAKITFRRVSSVKASEIYQETTNKGKADLSAFYLKMVEYAILGWEGVKDAADKDVPFKKEYLVGLPQDVVKELVDLITSKSSTKTEAKVEDEIKNL